MVAILSSFYTTNNILLIIIKRGRAVGIYAIPYSGKFKRKYAKDANCTICKRRFEKLIVSYTYLNLPVVHIIKFLIIYLYNQLSLLVSGHLM